MIDGAKNVWADVKRHPAATVLIILALSLSLYGNVAYNLQTARSLDRFHGDVCTVIAQAKKADAAQQKFYAAAATRSLARASHDHGALAQIDRNAADQSQHIADQYGDAQKFSFPGC